MPTRHLLALTALLGLLATACSSGDAELAGSTAPARGTTTTLAAAQAAPTAPAAPVAGITVEGAGRISGTPDTLTATVGVEVSRPDVQAALDAGNERAQAVIDAVLDAGVAREDVQTSQFDVYPQYDQQPGESQPTIRGYLVSNLLDVTIRDVDRAGDVLAAATGAAGDEARVQGVRFSLEDNQALVDQARERAFADARRRAEDYARLAGRELGALVSLDETATPSVPTARATQFDEAAADVARVPIEAGQQQVEVRVTAVWSMS